MFTTSIIPWNQCCKLIELVLLVCFEWTPLEMDLCGQISRHSGYNKFRLRNCPSSKPIESMIRADSASLIKSRHFYRNKLFRNALQCDPMFNRLNRSIASNDSHEILLAVRLFLKLTRRPIVFKYCKFMCQNSIPGSPGWSEL